MKKILAIVGITAVAPLVILFLVLVSLDILNAILTAPETVAGIGLIVSAAVIAVIYVININKVEAEWHEEKDDVYCG